MDKQAIIKALRDTAQSASNSVAETASLPVDAITWALRKAGLPVPENAVGSSDWMAQKGLTAPVEAGIPKMAGEVLGNVVPAIGFAKAPQIAAGMNRMVDNAMAPATMNKQAGAVYLPGGELSSNLEDAKKLASHIEAKGYKPNIIEANGGSVYVTADKPNFTKNGALSKRNPYSPLMAGEKPYKARFADHPSYWDSTVSSDPFTGNTVDQIIKNFDLPENVTLPQSRFNPAAIQGVIEEYSKVIGPSRSGKTSLRSQ